MKMGTIKQVPILILFSFLYGQDTLTIMNYNVLRFNGNTTVRAKHIKSVVDFVKPDIVILEEIEHQSAYNKRFEIEFEKLGWEKKPRIIGDLKKDLVFVEVQFGNSSTLYRDFYKFQYGLQNGLL